MQRLSTRFTVLVMLVIAISGAVFATASAMWLYNTAIERAHQTANASVRATRETLSDALWKVDHAAVRDAIAGLESVPEIGAVKVTTRNDETFGGNISNPQSDVDMALTYEQPGSDPIVLGRLMATLDMAAVQRRIQQLILVQAIVFGGLLLVIWALVRWAFGRLVDTPLRRLTTFILRPDLLTNAPQLRISEGPARRILEFQQLERALNDRLADHRRDWQELNDYKTRLEERVNARTQQLEAAQDEIVRNEKLAALGALVAGVAHELNTPIGNGLTAATTVGETIRTAESELAEGTLTKTRLQETLSRSRDAADIITSTLGRARELVANFKQVAVDRQSENRREFDLDEVIDETVVTLRPNLKKTPYEIETDLRAGLKIDGFPGPLGQVVTNLCDNAVRHAFDGRDSGTIRLESAPSNDGAHAILRVSDDGAGIPDEHIKRIFDPFFTTKLGEGGSGLGMAIVHRLVTQVMGGRIDVSSAPGQGTTFTIVLPTTAPASSEADDRGGS
jgi:signal transduction histidine kinase